MRKIPLSGPGWLVLAAAAAPIIIKASKPLARKVGQAFETFGQKLQEEAKEVTPNKYKEAEQADEEPRTETVVKDEVSKDSESNSVSEAQPATKVRQTKPKTSAKPKPKKTVKSSPAPRKTSGAKPSNTEKNDPSA